MEKTTFANILLNSRNLSVTNRRRVQRLWSREMKAGGEAVEMTISRGKQEHRPKDTAAFLSLFNNPKGFKFLTHDFNPGEKISYEEFLGGVKERFDEETKNKKIPQSLYALMKAFLKGGSEPWVAYDGTRQKENYGCSSWWEWIQKNPGEHVLTNGVFRETINLFRQTIRIISPALNDIVVKLAEKHPNLEINPVNLERADFYTYVYYLIEGIDRILMDISQRCGDHYVGVRPKVNISFKRVYGDDFSLRIISITHCGSKPDKPFDDVYQNYKKGGGAFNEIKSFFNGYCNWSVEGEWNDGPKRWDLLDDTGKAEIEPLPVAPEGFTHILTYYYK